ncbi:hypothetical protein Btru_014375 [Bulinus truncatus]|nr:hypothetical protein Btru_014375 [Bulinus truncatus]
MEVSEKLQLRQLEPLQTQEDSCEKSDGDMEHNGHSQEPEPLVPQKNSDDHQKSGKCDRRNDFTMKCLWDFHRLLLRGFYHYGYFLAKHPLWFLIIPVVMCVVFAVGFVKYNPERDIETLYTPANSRAIQDRETVVNTFPDLSATNYQAFSANRIMVQSLAIFRSKSPRSVLNSDVLNELKGFRQDVFSLRVVKDGQNFTYEDVCVRRRLAGPSGVTMCATDTDMFLLDPRFRNALSAGKVTYPFWSLGTQGMDLSLYIADVEMSEDKTILKAAGSFKFSFPLRQDTPEVRERSLAWELEYAEYMKNKEFSTVEFSYAISQSLNLELDKGTKGDIFYFSLTFTLMITYASLVSAGGDCVSTRALLANAGVLAAGLGIMGAFGLVTFCGVRFVNIVGVMPFLTLGIGVDDMFLLMGSWSEITAARGLTIPERIGHVFKKAGVGITITSLTDCLAFAVGSMSAFTSVKNFCIYTGVGVLLCYVCNATFFAACLTFHGRRVYSKRHTFTFKKVDKSRAELSNEGNTCCYAYLCGGAIPESPNDDQSVCEKAPKYFLTNFVLFKPVRLIIVILFVCYLGVSIWGCTKLRQGLELKDLVLDTSYFHKYQVWDTEDFGSKLPISFVTVKEKDYKDPTTLMNIIALLNETKKDAYIDKNIHNCWLTEFYKEPLINTTDDDAFFDRLNEFLMRRPGFRNDIVFGSDNKSITASRCQAYSVKQPFSSYYSSHSYLATAAMLILLQQPFSSCYSSHSYLATAAVLILLQQPFSSCYSSHSYLATAAVLILLQQPFSSCYSSHSHLATAAILILLQQPCSSCYSSRSHLATAAILILLQQPFSSCYSSRSYLATAAFLILLQQPFSSCYSSRSHLATAAMLILLQQPFSSCYSSHSHLATAAVLSS